MKHFKILIINEKERQFDILKSRFCAIEQSRNYVLSWCNSYEKAINSMLKSQFDVYLVFYRLGLYTGIDLLNEAVKSNVDEPIILIHDTEDPILDQQALKSGASGFLVDKDLDIFNLERSIRYAIHQRKTLQMVKETERKYRIIFEKSPEPIVITDSGGTVHDINPAGEKFFGISRIRSLKSNAGKYYKNEADRTALISQLERKGTVSNFITDLITADGDLRRCSVSSFLQISQHGNTELFYTIIHDISNLTH